MSTTIYPMRFNSQDSRLFRAAAKQRQISVAEFLRRAGRKTIEEAETIPASLKLSREGFVLKNETGNGNGERAKIRAAILKRHVSR
jgi:hypothetical protein